MKKWIILLVIAVLAAGGWYYYTQQLQGQAHEGQDITDLSQAWLDEEEYNKALEQLQSQPPIAPALVITAEATGNRRVAIAFAGMPDRTDTAILVDLLQKHNMTAAFFVEGQNAGDMPEALSVITNSGNEVGNYTFVGATALDKLPQEDVLRDFCRSQKAILVSGAQTVRYAMAARTQVNDPILQAVHAAGIDYWVKPNVNFIPNSLHTPADADAFVASVPVGSIICIPTGTTVDVVTYEPNKADGQPAVDKQPTIVDNPPAQPGPKKEKLVDEVALLLDALDRAKVKVESVGTFRQIKYIPAAAAAPAPQGVKK